MNISSQSLSVIATLRPPFARSALLVYPFASEGTVNSGITVETTASGDAAVAPGSGTVKRIYTALPQWPTTDTALHRTTVQHVEIDHGGQIVTTVGGMTTVTVHPGQLVTRGDRLGTQFGTQLFFAVSIGGKGLNPVTLNRHWLPQNGNVVTGQGGRIRFAPDRVLRDLSGGIVTAFNDGINYFKQLLAPEPLLVNVSFNGDGSKTGLAATGYTGADYWNVYTPVDFDAAASAACNYAYSGAGFYDFSAPPVLNTSDYAHVLSPVVLERIAPMLSAAGTAVSWDNMLKTWIGGYLGPVPYENTFRLRNLPAGAYNLFLYANQGTVPNASTFYVSVNAGLPTTLANDPTATAAFVEGRNYTKFSLTLPARGYITFKAVGYLSGMQLQRT